MNEKYSDKVHEFIDLELKRQKECIELIASENYASEEVMRVQGSVLTNKYAEGYPGKRYYLGCEYVDEIESLAIERAKKLFGCQYANVQPHSGSGANQAVFLALISPGSTILGMSLEAGGHLTHGAAPNMSGKWFNTVHYGVDSENYIIDYNEVEAKALEHKPRLIIAGYSAYSKGLDVKRFREIADKIGAYLLVDIAHIAGLVATGMHESPFPHAHVVTSTTHKTLRGPRGGLILTDSEELSKKINSAIFPGLQGGPLMHVIGAKAVAFREALEPSFKDYIKQVIANARALGTSLMERGYKVIGDGTDNHMILLDLRPQGITGKDAANILDRAGITCNKNNIPFDTTSPFITSGLRFGSPACTTRGFGEQEFIKIGQFIADILDAIKNKDEIVLEQKINYIKNETLELSARFPIY